MESVLPKKKGKEETINLQDQVSTVKEEDLPNYKNNFIRIATCPVQSTYHYAESLFTRMRLENMIRIIAEIDIL